MGDVAASRWDVDEIDNEAPPRAKPVVRRGPAVWREDDGVHRSIIGRWSVTVALVAPSVWEWAAFATPLPRALGCKGFGSCEAARQDAEITLASE